MITFITQSFTYYYGLFSSLHIVDRAQESQCDFLFSTNLNDLVGKGVKLCFLRLMSILVTHGLLRFSFIVVLGGCGWGGGRGLLFSSLRLLHRLSPHYAIKSCQQKVSQSIQLMLHPSDLQ